MDPNACLLRILHLLKAKDYSEARYAALGLATWVDKGGFSPNWFGVSRRATLYFKRKHPAQWAQSCQESGPRMLAFRLP